MRLLCTPTDTWLMLQVQSWRSYKQQVTKVWGHTLSATLVACADSGVRRLASRSACFVVGRAFRWSSGADTILTTQTLTP